MKVAKRRRRENRTNYYKRLKMLSGNLPRVVFRKTNRYVLAQLVESNDAQDRIITGINSKELLKYGWPKEKTSSLKTLPACYLIGLLFGKKIGEKDCILDIGIIRNIKKSRIYAFLKGLVDSGVKIRYNEKAEIFPSKDRITGKHLKEDFSEFFNKIKGKIENE